MNKSEMAQRFAEIFAEKVQDPHKVKSKEFMGIIAENACKLADAMQAEADKREDKTRPAVLQEEWQPDWSQAPDTAIAWEMRYGSNTEARWCHDKDKAGFSYTVAPTFNYQGHWKNSLRKRPE